MKTIEINPNTVFDSKYACHKIVKVCNLFVSKVEFTAGNNVVDMKSSAEAVERLKFDGKAALNICGEDEKHAELMIKECIGY